ncbi:D-alanyl-D-alanine carboxypeptidase family protein [Lysinibacillus sp. 54212]|uniref:D-alanyl-D-alanine carboxypeptidase family protein n=1 Tax=Lysinibacillus sp. 54212 TaxID=3119829 RepID=UPI002FCC28E2
MSLTRILLILLMVFILPVSASANSSYVAIDATTGRVLMGEEIHMRLPIASLTKMWTALIAIEESDLDDVVTISKRATLSEGSSIYLEEGESVTVETLLYGLLLRSGNDAAFALAEHVGGSEEGFVKLMNDKARIYGLINTSFTNPSGLHNENHLSSAYDTARMLQIAMKNPTFRKIASTIIYKGKTTTWQNKHKLLSQKVGALAGKTGYTKVAGRTLATYFERDEKKFVVVTINASNDWQLHKSIADTIDDNYKVEEIAKKGSYEVPHAKLKLAQPIRILLSEKEEEELQHVLQLTRSKRQAVWHIMLDNRVIYSTPVDVQ